MVIICQVNEPLHSFNLKNSLQECTIKGITLEIPEVIKGVLIFPIRDKPLYESETYRVREKLMDKPHIFNPRESNEIYLSPGRHSAFPSENVVTTY